MSTEASAATPNVNIVVQAEDEDGEVFVWNARYPSSEPLRKLAQMWADAHSIPHDAVGFDDAKDQQFDLDKTATELGWELQSEVRIFAWPLESHLTPEGSQMATSEDKSVKAERPIAGKRPAPTRETGQPEKRRCSNPPTATDAAVDPPKAVAPATSVDGVKTSTKSSSSGGRHVDSQQVKEKTLPSGAVKAPAKPGKKAEQPKRDEASSEMPSGDDPIVYVQENPKREGGKAFENYEKYKAAKTVNEARELGAASGDLKHDWQKGFYKRA